jgi:1-acyl-sn-glycerol-3-phosphate acyltransferase
MIFTLAYIPFVLIMYHYFGVSMAGLWLAILAVLLIAFSYFTHQPIKKSLSPFIAFLIGIGAYISENFITLKLYPLLLSLLFLLYFILSIITKRYPIIGWVEKFKKRTLRESELRDVIVSHWYWVGILAINSLIHLYLVVKNDTTLWALYSFAGWYLYFGMAMIFQLLFAHREGIFQWVRNIWGYGLFGGVIVIGFIPAIVGYWFNRLSKKSKPHVWFQRVTAAMFRIFFRFAPRTDTVNIQINVPYRDSQPYIYVASHESWLDYPLMGAYITDLYHLTNKKNAFSWSIRGVAKLLGVIDGVGNNALHALLQKLREGSNVLIFPEGSREVDGVLLPFKKGAFALSLASGVSIIPVIISGTRKLVPKGSIHWQNTPNISIQIQMLEPIHPHDGESAEELKQRVWDIMNAVQKNHNG